MGKGKPTTPKWVELKDLAKSITTAGNHLLSRRAIFDIISTSETASDKDKAIANGIISEINDIITDNTVVLKNISKIVLEKTKLKPRAGIKEKDQDKYIELLTNIDSRVTVTCAFDEMLLQKLNKVTTPKKEEV